MAHRLPPAGVCTPLSEHYVNYFVIPKPTQCSVSLETQSSSCCIRPNFVSLSQPPAQTSYKCVDLSQPRPLGVECTFKASCHHPQRCCLHKPCPRYACCCAREDVNRSVHPDSPSPICCCSAPDCCCNGDHTCAINITLPRSDDQVIEQKLKRSLKKLKNDVEKFDQALACIGTRNPETVQQCVPAPCKPRCCCCCSKPIPARDLCCAPRDCRKPVCLNCQPFYGKKKTCVQCQTWDNWCSRKSQVRCITLMVDNRMSSSVTQDFPLEVTASERKRKEKVYNVLLSRDSSSKGHNRLRNNKCTKFKIGETAMCTCGLMPQTADHILQDCPKYDISRRTFWPRETIVEYKLYGPLSELKERVTFIHATTLQL